MTVPLCISGVKSQHLLESPVWHLPDTLWKSAGMVTLVTLVTFVTA
jgi:hypothetical protein